MVNQLMEAVDQIRESEEFQAAVAKGSEVALQAQEQLEEGMHMATDAAAHLQELHESGELQKGLTDAASKVQEGVRHVQQSVASGEVREQLQKAASSVQEGVASGAEQLKESAAQLKEGAKQLSS